MKYIVLIPSYNPDEKLINLIKSINKKIDIVVVNDGSESKYNKVFKEAKKYSHVISYDENMGKGYAIKKGLSYIKEKYKEYSVVTMDADGQHLFSDALKLLEYSSKHLDTLVIGKRHWDKTTPVSSRFGNSLARKLYKKYTGIDIYDTQSGLRAFSNKLIDYMLDTEGYRYEYEINVLMYLPENNIKVHEIDIETIYINNNESSHYRTISDTYSIYKSMKEARSRKIINKNKTIISITILLFLFIVLYVIGYDTGKKIIGNNFIKVTYSKNCNEPMLYYKYGKRNIYFYCIDELKIKDGKKYIELDEFLIKNDMAKILNGVNLSNILRDKETNIYIGNDSTKVKMNNLTIIKCNTVSGNKDIYIGTTNMMNYCILK